MPATADLMHILVESEYINLWIFRNVSENDALDYVFGYTVGIDYTARDLMARNGGIYPVMEIRCFQENGSLSPKDLIPY